MFAYEDRIKYRDWVDGKSQKVDLVGHGTHAAGLLLKIAPNAIVCVARVVRDGTTKIDTAIITKVNQRLMMKRSRPG